MDYVTEKLYDAFVAGCVPLYLGAPNIANLLPDPDAIIDYRQAPTSLLSYLSTVWWVISITSSTERTPLS